MAEERLIAWEFGFHHGWNLFGDSGSSNQGLADAVPGSPARAR